MAGAGDGGEMECIPRLLLRAMELLEKAAGVGEELAGLRIDLHGVARFVYPIQWGASFSAARWMENEVPV